MMTEGEDVKIVVDADRCEMNAVCVGLAPDVFDIADDHSLKVVGEVTVDNEDHIRNAVAACPKSALSLARNDRPAG